MTKKEDKTNLQHYIDIVQKVARVEHRRIPSHMVEYEELLSIGIIAIQVMIKNKTPEQLEKYNSAYIATAVRWAIRNELRIRYKWYSLKHKAEDEYDEEEVDIDKVSDGIFNLDGTAYIEDVEHELDITITDADDDYDTIGGYLTDKLGRLPDDGEKREVIVSDYVFKILSVKDHRIESIVAQKIN